MQIYKSKYTFQERLKQSQEILLDFPGALPMIVGPHPESKLPPLHYKGYQPMQIVCGPTDAKVSVLIDTFRKQVLKMVSGFTNKKLQINFWYGDLPQKSVDPDQTLLEYFNNDDGFFYLTYREQPPKEQDTISTEKIEEAQDEGHQPEFLIEQDQKMQIKAKCAGGHQATQICCQQECKQSSIFVCFEQKCRCQANHEKCTMISIKSAVQKIKRKFLDFDKIGLEEQIDKVFDKMIDDISAIRDNLITSFKQSVKYCQVKDEELQFLNCLETGATDDEIFLDSHSLKQLLYKRTNPEDFLVEMRQKLKKMEETHFCGLDKIDKIVKTIDERLKPNRLKDLERVKEVHVKEFHKFKESSIIKPEHVKVMLRLYFSSQQKDLNLLVDQMPNVSHKLVFKASQNDFDISKYFEKCGNLKNTLIVCLTNQNKIIGGFSPLSHCWNEKENYQDFERMEDEENRSFLFTLTEMQKYKIICAKEAIYRDKKHEQITFGIHEFEICDKSNSQRQCRSVVNNVYLKDFRELEYQRKGFYEFFNGNYSQTFTTKEWEVWQVDFVENDKP